jgi:hypothetical protein
MSTYKTTTATATSPTAHDEKAWENTWSGTARHATAESHHHHHHHHGHFPPAAAPAAAATSKQPSTAERLREYLGLRLHTTAEKLHLSRFLRKRATAVLRGESFIPCTKLTFLADRAAPGSLMCELCQATHLVVMGVDYGRGSHGEARQGSAKYAHRDAASADSVPAFLPCGHVAGSACLGLWLEEHDSCPFCRATLRYRKCGHKLAPRPAADVRDMHMLPATVPEGGAIPDRCTECFQAELEVDFQAKWARALQEFQHDEARAARLEKRGVKGHWLRVQERKDVLDNLYSVEVLEPLGRRWAQRGW